MGENYAESEKHVLEEREMLQSIKRTLEHIETILMRMERNQRTESAEDFYKRHGITQTFA